MAFASASADIEKIAAEVAISKTKIIACAVLMKSEALACRQDADRPNRQLAVERQ